MFDPYHRWLAIPPSQRPPTYYQLLGISPDETEREVIEEAALRQASHVRTYQTGPYAQQCQALLNEIGQAKVTLLHSQKRKDYDARLGRTAHARESQPQTETSNSSVPPPTSVPEPGSFPFDFSVNDTAECAPAPALPVGNAKPTGLLLSYAGLLLLGALLAFWLSLTRP